MLTGPLFLLLAVGAPGLLLCLVATRARPGWLELCALTPALGLLFAPAVGVALAAVEAFDAPRLLLAEAALLAPVALVLRRCWRWRRLRRALALDARRRRVEHAALAALVVAALALVGRPSEWVLSEHMDAANYVVQAAYQARHAGLFLDDGQAELYAADFPRAVWRLNSTSGQPRGDGRRQLPFPPLFKMQLALLVLGGGVRLALHGPLVLGVTAALCGHVALRAVVRGRFHALLGTVLLLGSPLLVQFMRVTLAEVTLLLATLTGLALLAVALERGSRAAGALGGAALGLAPLVRADGLLVTAGGFAALAAAGPALAGATWRATGAAAAAARAPALRAFTSAFALASVAAWHTSVHAASSYLADQRLPLGVVSAALAAAAALAVVAALPAGPALPALRHAWPAAAWAGRAALVLGALHAFVVLLVQPLAAAPAALTFLAAQVRATASPGAPESWLGPAYLGAPAVAGGVAGVLLVARRPAGLALAWMCILLPGAALYLLDLRHNPGAYWASRRYLPQLLPLLTVGAAVACARLVAHRRTARLAVVLAVAAGLVAQHALLTVRNGRHYLGAVDGLAALAGRFAPDDVVLIDGDAALADALQLGLRYVHGREALAPRFSSVSDDELRAFARRHAGRRLHVVVSDPATLLHLERLFGGERGVLTLGYRHWIRRSTVDERVEWLTLHVTSGKAP